MPKIVRFHELGQADVLKLEELPLAEPEEGELRIKVEAIGLNRAEVIFRKGQYLESPELPSKLGYEAAGVVDAIGAGVEGFQIGDRVSSIPAFSMTKYGVYGESAILPVNAVAHYPENLSAAEGAAIWMQYLTAYGALIHYGKMKKEDVVLITAASSSVGLAAIQLTKAAGALAIATTRGADKKQFILDAGADHVIVTDEEDLAKRVIEITSGAGANLIFDPVGGPALLDLAAAAAQGASIYEYGALSRDPTPFPLLPSLAKALTVRGYTLFELTQSPELCAQAAEYIFNKLQSGELKPVIDEQHFSLDEIADAQRYMETNKQKGKIVVTV